SAPDIGLADLRESGVDRGLGAPVGGRGGGDLGGRFVRGGSCSHFLRGRLGRGASSFGLSDQIVQFPDLVLLLRDLRVDRRREIGQPGLLSSGLGGRV